MTPGPGCPGQVARHVLRGVHITRSACPPTGGRSLGRQTGCAVLVGRDPRVPECPGLNVFGAKTPTGINTLRALLLAANQSKRRDNGLIGCGVTAGPYLVHRGAGQDHKLSDGAGA